MIPLNNMSRLALEHFDELASQINSVVMSGSYILGKHVEQFEISLANYIGRAYVIAVGSGTDALTLSLRAMDLSGGYVALQPNCGGYSSTAIHLNNAKAVYIDCLEDGSMDPRALEEALQRNVEIRAVIITHLYGLIGNILKIVEICKKYKVHLLEDCAQSVGASLEGRQSGSFGNSASFSFYPTKNLGALGDSGAIATDDKEFAMKLRMLRQYGWSNKYEVDLELGINSRMDEIQAAVLASRLRYLDSNNDRRREIWAKYQKVLTNSKWSIIGIDAKSFVAHLAVLICPLGKRQETENLLHSRGISTAVHYPIVDYKQIAWQRFQYDFCPNAEMLSERILTIPLFPSMQASEIEEICLALGSLDQVIN